MEGAPGRGGARETTHRRLILLLAVSLFLPLPLLSQQGRQQDDLIRIRREIEQFRRRLSDLQVRQRSAEVELETVQLQLDIRTRELELALDAKRSLEYQQREIETRIEALGDRIGRQKRELAARLAALYRLGPLSYLRVLFAMDTRQSPLAAVSMLNYLITRDARAVQQFQDTKTKLAVQRLELSRKREQSEKVGRLIAEQRESIARTRREKQAVLARIQSEGFRAQQRLTQLEEKARRLERLMSLLYGQKGKPHLGGTSIEDFRGALGWPLRGEVLEGFGRHRNPKFATVTVSNGIKIAATPGTEVRAVFQGTVLYSQWFKGYGNLIIVDHGKRIFSLYGNTTAPRVAVGDRVQPQQLLATVGPIEDDESGYLYFEIREDNRPVDPRTWLR